MEVIKGDGTWWFYLIKGKLYLHWTFIRVLNTGLDEEACYTFYSVVTQIQAIIQYKFDDQQILPNRGMPVKESISG